MRLPFAEHDGLSLAAANTFSYNFLLKLAQATYGALIKLAHYFQYFLQSQLLLILRLTVMATDRERTPYHDASDDIRPSIEDSEGETDNQRAGSSQPEGAQVQASERLDRSDRTGADPPEGERVLRSPSENGFTVADFENTDIRKMADAVDSLRDIGVGADIALPQVTRSHLNGRPEANTLVARCYRTSVVR